MSAPAKSPSDRRRPVRRPGSLRATVLAVAALSAGIATAVFGGLFSQMAAGGDPGLGGEAPVAKRAAERPRAVAPRSVSAPAPAAPAVPEPDPVTTQVS
jgi:hypothetical protein